MSVLMFNSAQKSFAGLAVLARYKNLLHSFCLSCGLVIVSPVALAQIHAMPFASVGEEYNSNIFALPRYATAPIGQNGASLSDHLLEYRAGLNALYDLSLQEFYGNFEYRHLSYSNFTDLNHDEYLVHGGWKWKATSLFDGFIDYRQERSMVQFLDFQSTSLFLQRQETATGTANIHVTPYWQLETQGALNKLDSPRPGLPNLSLTEDSIREGVRYLGLARVSGGADISYLKGHFNGDEFILAPRYDQMTIDAAAKYTVSGFSRFDGAVGFTRRGLQGSPAVSGLTGLLAYERDLSVLTKIRVALSRAVNTYVTYQGSEIDTSASIEGNWNAFQRILVTPAYQWTYSTFPQGTLAGVTPTGGVRSDHYQLLSLTMKYQVVNWLDVGIYGRYETRRSDVESFAFNRSVIGISVELRLAGQSDQPYQLSLPEN